VGTSWVSIQIGHGGRSVAHILAFVFRSMPLMLFALAPGLVLALPDQPAFLVQVSRTANLVYQLDCISGSIHCSRDAYVHLWNVNLQWGPADQTELEKWKRVREKYSGPLVLQEPKSAPLSLAWNGEEGVQLDEKFLIAAFHAGDLASLRNGWEALIAPADLVVLNQILVHFQPRFDSWWNRYAAAESERFRREMQAALKERNLEATIASFARFYGVNLPLGFPIYFNLFFRPAFRDTHTLGTEFENHAVVEFLPGEDVRKRLTVVLHELCHFFYSSAPFALKQQLTLEFANSSDPAAMAGWALLNESLATALGNGLASQQLRPAAFQTELPPKLSFYNNLAIDSAAKALVTFLRGWIDQGKTLYDQGFLHGYLNALETAMPDLLMMPARLLNEVTILYDPVFASAVSKSVLSQLSGGIYPEEGLGQTSWSMLHSYPRMNAIVFVSTDSLTRLENDSEFVSSQDLSVMKQATQSEQNWVYAIQRFPSTYLFVIGGRTGQDASMGFSRLMNAKQRFTGLLRERTGAP
jgi:hypothetical protein